MLGLPVLLTGGAVVAVILSDLAYATGQRQIYDHRKREIRAG